MKRTYLLHLFIIVCVIMGLFTSCNNESVIPQEKQIEKELEKKEEDKVLTYDMDGGETTVVINVTTPSDNGKALSSNHNNTYEYFLLTTQYLSERRDGSTITGEFTDLKLAANGDGGRNNVDLGWFTQGKWQFSIKALNSDNDVLYIGSWAGYVSSGTPNSISISMQENSAEVGSIAFEMVSITLPSPRVVITYSKVWNGNGEHVLLDTSADGRGLVMTDTPNGYTTYVSPALTLPAGAYWIKVQLWSGDELFSGEVLDTYIVPKKTTTISGEFTITGIANFIRVMPGQTFKFTEACQEVEIASGTIITGFHKLGDTGRIDFPYSNDTDDVQYIIPENEEVSTYFSLSSSGAITGTGYPYKYIAFSNGYADSPVALGDDLFSGTAVQRNQLEAIYAPSVVVFGKRTFQYTNLNDTVFGTIDSIGASCFKGSLITNFDNSRFSNSVQIDTEAFMESSIAYIDIPTGATVGASAFKNATSLYRTAFYPINVPKECFMGCTGLTSLELQNTVNIGEKAFSGCTALSEMILPETLKTIGSYSFENCSGLLLTQNIPSSVKTIEANAFKGTSGLDEIYLNAICGDIAGEPWGATCNITWWGYKLFFNSSLPADYIKAEGEEEFPQITEKNGQQLSYPVDDPKYRLIAYNDVIGATLDGYTIPIPVIDGYALRGWFTEPVAGDEITQLTVNTHRENWTVYAHWVRGLITIVFSGGRGGTSNTGVSTETYRMVRYRGYYSRVGEEDEIDDYDKALPTASIEGRDFVGWYTVQEPMLADGISPDETSQEKLYNDSVAELRKFAAEQEYDTSKLTLVIDKNISGVRLRTPVYSKKSHTVYAHYKDHRYTVQFNANLPTNASVYGTRNGTNVSASYNTPSSYTVVYNQLYSKEYDLSKKTSSSYTGVSRPLPDLNSNTYKLDNYWFCGWYLEPECINRVWDSTRVAAQSKNGAVINLYAKWIGKEKTVNYYSRYKDFPTDSSYVQDTITTVVHRFSAPNIHTNSWMSYFNKTVVSGKEQDISQDIGFALPSPFRTGYTFDGWYTGFNNDKNVVSGEPIIDGNTITGIPSEVKIPGPQNLYAKWVPNKYTVTFDYRDGRANTTKTVTYDSQYGDLPKPTRAGYIFVGWFDTTERVNGYGYSDAQYLSTQYVRTPANHTLYAAWTAVEVIPGSTTAWSSSVRQLNVSRDFVPTADCGFYGNGSSNIHSESIAFKTVCVPTRNGAKSSSTGKWSDSSTLDLYAVDLSFAELASPTGRLVATYTASGGVGTITISSTASSVPGSQKISITNSLQGDNPAGTIEAMFRGYVNQINLRAENTLNPGTNVSSIQCRETAKVTASYVATDNSAGYVHYSQGLINKWTVTNGATNAESPVYTSGTSTCTVRAKYETTSITLSAEGKENKKGTITLLINVPANTIAVKNNENAPTFLDMVATIYKNNATAKAQWMITGFGQFEGISAMSSIGNALVSESGNLWKNTTGHTVYLYPYIESVISSANSTCTIISAKNSNMYVAFPSNVTQVGNGSKMFSGSCKQLYIANESGVTIGAEAFNGAGITGLTIKCIKTVNKNGFASNPNMPSWGDGFANLVTIGESAFYKSFTNTNNVVVDLKNCTSIGSSAFRESGVGSITVYSSCGTISSYAFYNCSKLSSATIHSTTIQDHAFESSKINTIAIYNTQTIGTAAFKSCSGLVSITFPNSLQTIGSEAFQSAALTSISNFTAKATANNMSSLTSIGASAFYGCKIGGAIYLPYTVTTIGDNAFRSNYVTSVTFGSQISSIGSNAFYECGSLSAVDFLDKGSGFNNISFGGNVWYGCQLRTAKISIENFPYGGHTGSVNNGNANNVTYYFNPGYAVSFEWTVGHKQLCCNSDDAYTSNVSHWTST